MLKPRREVKILDFDIENRPLTYWADRPSAEITAIASAWSAEPVTTWQVFLLGRDDPRDALIEFKARYDEADMVTGHYIRRHDLPIINGAMMEFGLPQLGPKLTCDTRLDMRKKGDIPATQEYLAEALGVPSDKYHMTQVAWREANRLTPKGLELTRMRVIKDVAQHMMLRNRMLELNLLTAPKVWKP